MLLVITVFIGACGSDSDLSSASGSDLPADFDSDPIVHCEAVTSGGSGKDNAPLEAELCVSNSTIGVDESVILTVRAEDGDATLSALGDCAPNAVFFGDEEELCFTEADCAEDLGNPAPNAGAIDKTLEHSYGNAGTYEVRAILRSGGLCPNPFSNEVTVSVGVVVID